MNVVVGKAGRIVIPAAVREALALAEGTQLAIIVRDGVIELHDPSTPYRPHPQGLPDAAQAEDRFAGGGAPEGAAGRGAA